MHMREITTFKAFPIQWVVDGPIKIIKHFFHKIYFKWDAFIQF